MRLPPILLVGGGKMGGAMLAGWREQGLERAVVVTPSRRASLGGQGIEIFASPEEIPAGFEPEAVIFAVKPQKAAEILPSYARFAEALFLSVMAGKSLATLAGWLGRDAAILRAMPNTPAAIRQGMTVGVPNAAVSAAQCRLATRLLAAVGEVEIVGDEAILEPVTAISGGGPAYLFLLTELMEVAARARGVPAALARRMARQTLIGAGALLGASPEDAAALRAAVTSPGGTTQQALAVLQADDAWPKSLADAVDAAIQRSRALDG